MSGENSLNPCNRFEPNIYYKNKCQNCFKSRELHLQTDHVNDQAKPIYGGWLCLAPEGTDFNNPMQKSRKWQRRFFILYENGSLSFALDELTCTLPQGTVNVNLCTEVLDAEPKTGQRNALCIVTPEQEFFIRGENKEIINGWSEKLALFPRNNKQNQNKKRKVDSTTSQEPSPAKMAATEPGHLFIASGDTRSSFGQEERPAGGPDVDTLWVVTDPDPLGLDETPAVCDPHHLPTTSSDSVTFGGGSRRSKGSCFRSNVANKGAGSSDGQFLSHPPAHSNHSPARRHYSEPERLLREAPEKTRSHKEMDHTESSRGRSKARSNDRERLQSSRNEGPVHLSATLPQRRAKSLERRTSESVMTPDLLNFKKGWLMKLDKEDKWMKYWFVLSADTLRFYKDSLAEENSDVDGQIDLTKCHNVSEYQVQRNYGFQIHTQKCVYTLSAMTAGIRRNWILALMKNVRPFNAPDIASSLPVHHILCSPPDDLPLPKPDVTRDSSLTTEAPSENAQWSKHLTCEKRLEDPIKTFDWIEFKPMLATEQAVKQDNVQAPEMEFVDLEKKRRREERRRRYEGMLGFPQGWEVDCGGGDTSQWSLRTQQREIEQCWQLVEKSALRPERTVPLYMGSMGKGDLEMLLVTMNRRVEDLKDQLAESEHRRMELEANLSTEFGPQHHIYHQREAPSSLETGLGSLKSLMDPHMETRDLLQQQPQKRQCMQEGIQLQLGLSLSTDSLETPCSSGSHPSPPPSIWLHDTEGKLQKLVDLFHDSSMSGDMPASETDRSSGLQNGRENKGPTLGCETSSQTQFQNGSHQHTSLLQSTAFSPNSLSMEENLEKTNSFGIDKPTCCETPRATDLDPDQAIALRRLSQEVELLIGQNKALDQRSQEMLNQLTEADREIERLRAEIVSQHSGPEFLSGVGQHIQAEVEGLKSELIRRDQQLREAQLLVDSLDERLRDTEVQLQLREVAFKGRGSPAAMETEEEDDNRRDDGEEEEEKVINPHLLGVTEGESFQLCLRAMEFKKSELGKQLLHREQSCRELQANNPEPGQRVKESGVDIMRLSEDIEIDRMLENESGLRCCSGGKWQDEIVLVSGERKTQQVVEGIMLMCRSLGTVLQVIDRSDTNVVKAPFDKEHVEINETRIRQVNLGEQFWGGLLKCLKAKPSQSTEDRLMEILLCQSLEHMVLLNQMLHLAHSLFAHADTEEWSVGKDLMNGCRSLGDLGNIGNRVDESGSETGEIDNKRIFNVYNQLNDTDDFFRQHFTEITQERMLMLNQIASWANASADINLRSMAQRLYHYHRAGDPWLSSIHRTVMEAFLYYRISTLDTLHKNTLQDTQQGRLTALSLLVCSSCAGHLNAKVGLRVEHCDSQTTATLLQDNNRQQDTRIQNQERTAGEEACCVVEGGFLINSTDSSTINVDGRPSWPVKGIQEFDWEIDVEYGTTPEPNEGKISPGEDGIEVVLTSLRGRVKDLEGQLSIINEVMKAEQDGITASLRLKHNEEVEKLKAIYEHGFVNMEGSHQKALIELRYRHQQELLRFQRDTDRLLEEETAATVTAIEAMKNAHRAELEREIQRACHTHSNVGDLHLGKICRLHSEDLASCHKELEVLCQQYCLKCLEGSRLAQTLEAERMALTQCQQENSDLRTRNQELSGHLTSEITRLYSLDRQEAFPFGQQRDVYELEIAQRVKESEVQFLEQQITSLKGQLQTAHMDNMYMSEKFKDISAELSTLRAKAGFDLDQLRENLRLAHEALGELLPAGDSDNECEERQCC